MVSHNDSILDNIIKYNQLYIQKWNNSIDE